VEKNLKRLSLDISDELHQEIKIRAAKRNITMKKYIVRSILDLIKKEKEYELPE